MVTSVKVQEIGTGSNTSYGSHLDLLPLGGRYVFVFASLDFVFVWSLASPALFLSLFLSLLVYFRGLLAIDEGIILLLSTANSLFYFRVWTDAQSMIMNMCPTQVTTNHAYLHLTTRHIFTKCSLTQSWAANEFLTERSQIASLPPLPRSKTSQCNGP
jgi:hypothetical protein